MHTHNEQIAFIEALSRDTSSIQDRNMYASILTSLFDSKSHITHSNKMIHITMSNERYKEYINKVVTPK